MTTSKTKRMESPPWPALRLGFLLAALTLGSGCQSHLAFGTATKFGLDISQKPDQSVDLTLGYRRAETASIPVAAKDSKITDADDSHDAYSVLARFAVTYDPQLLGTVGGLHLHQFFATGMAARKAAETPNMQKAFGKAAFEVKEKK